MVYLGFFHASLSVFVIKEVEYILEETIRIIHYIGECSALPISQERFLSNGDVWIYCIFTTGSRHFRWPSLVEDAYHARAIIVFAHRHQQQAQFCSCLRRT